MSDWIVDGHTTAVGGRGAGDSAPFDWPRIDRERSEQAGEGTYSQGAVVSDDPVNHPAHYTWLPNGVEVIDIAEQFNFTLGNAIKYIMRAGRKGSYVQDLEKARWYIDREIARIKG